MEYDASWWLDSPDGLEIGGSGLSATLRDYARFGLYMLNGGRIGGRATLPVNWIADATVMQPFEQENGTETDAETETETEKYGYMWWPLENGAYSAIGIFGQFVFVHPKTRTVVAMWSAQPKPVGTDVIDEFDFLNALVKALPLNALSR
jgi:CubicO group peptidase (beta-lactamase class C family)